MPVEIKELHIKMNISDNPETGQPSVGNATANMSTNSQNSGNSDNLVKECVDRVLEILKTKMSR
jgi:Family of unknown function (DUF5908)